MRNAESGLAVLCLLCACGGGSTSIPDAGFRDAGATSDAAAPADAGSSRDAGVSRDAGPPADAGPRIRIVAANLTSGNRQSYDPGEGIRILRGLTPDLVLVQEFNFGTNTSTAIRQLAEEVMGSGASFHRGATGNIPNGIISRWTILEAGTWVDREVGNRGFTWARIDIPGSIDLWAVSVHLLTANAGTRNREAVQLVDEITNAVPDADFLVIGGDLNTNTRSEAALATLETLVSTARVPVDRNGNDNTNGPRSRPYDWVLPDDDLDALHIPVVIGPNVFEDGLVFDSRVFTPLTAVPPVQFGDSDAPQMQHMAVVRDFARPAP